MKIGIVCDQFGNFNRGGAEVQLDKTMLYLNRIEGVQAELVSYNSRNLEEYDLFHFFKSLQYFSEFAKFLVDKKKPYVVSSIFFPNDNYNAVLFRYRNARYLPQFIQDAFGPSKTLYLWKNAQFVFPNTDKEADFIEQTRIKANVKIIPNGLDLEEMPEVEAELFLNAYPALRGEKFVLNVARIDRRKNQKKLVEACMKLNIPVVIIGTVGDETYYQEIKALNYDKLTHIGPIYDNRELLFSAYNACEVFCLPSTMETPGLAAMEAAYYNKPIVITKYGGTEYYFKNQAYYVDWANIDEIAKGISFYYEKSNTPANQRQLILQYSWDKIAQQYVDLYKKILEKK